MAAALIKLDEFTASGETEIIIGSGSNGSSGLNATMDSTYNVYVITANGVTTSSDNQTIKMRYVISGVLQSGSFYDRMGKKMFVSTVSDVSSRLNSNAVLNTQAVGNAANEEVNAELHFFNFPDTSTHSFNIKKSITLNNTGALYGFVGGDRYAQREAHDGVGFYTTTGNIATGEFELYGLRK